MSLDNRLIAKGKNEPRAGLMQQGRFHVGLAHQHATELADAGWSSDDTISFTANVAKLDVATGTQAKAYDDASDNVTSEARAIDGAKGFLRRLRNALPRALRETPSAGVTLDSFHAGETLGRSTPKIAKFLARIRPAVVSLDPALKKHFKGSDASAELDAAKTALDQADTMQELSRKQAPIETLAVYEVMGKVLEQIEDLNRAGKSAFDGDAATRGKFNKDILLRARKAAKKPDDAPATEPTPKPTPVEASPAAPPSQPVHAAPPSQPAPAA
jgi:hypothetical protein